MDTIKFSKISNLCTEQHNLKTSKVEKTEIFNQQYFLYKPCNLNIFITNICPNKCEFCINKEYYGQDISDEKYYFSLEKVLCELKDKRIEVTITGGEPTLKKERFVKTMQMCNVYNIKPRTISTTGLNLLKVYDNKPLCQHMLENKFVNNISLSRMHYNDDINLKIMGHNRLSNDEIEKLALFFKLNNADLRLSTNLIEGSIDSLQKVLEYLKFYSSRGIESVIYRQLVGEYTNLIDNIFDEINNSKDFIFIERTSGMFYDVDIYKYEDFLVKCYHSKKNFDKNVIYNLSLRNGILTDGFDGNKIYREF